MKKIKNLYLVIAILTFFVFILSYCTKDNHVLDLAPTYSNNELQSVKTTAPPTIDGTEDVTWAGAPVLHVMPTVPDPGNGLFAGYIGEKYPATIQSMYDDQYIYFLVKWDDATNNSNVTPWYFDPTTKRWNQEASSRQYDANGKLIREGWGEDKLAMLWNVNFSTPKFISQTCYASCHVFTPYVDTSGKLVANASGNHYTNGQNEKIDMWWGRLGYMAKSNTLHFMDDNYQDWAGGPSVYNLVGGNANGRHVDDIYPDGTKSPAWPYRPNYTTSPSQGEINNRISLKITGTNTTVNVPWYVSPGAATANFILATDTATLKRTVAIDNLGVLTFSDGTTLDPNATTDYNRTGDPVTGGVGPKSIPGFIAAPLIGSRADIVSAATYTGTGWVVEYKRKLKTIETLNQDVDFSGLVDQQFGIAIWNASNNQHGINPDLILKFKK